MIKELEIKEGDILLCQTLEWTDGWEFDHPSMMLSPVIRCYENGSSHDYIVEDVLIDAVCVKKIKSEDFEKSWGWRGYKLTVLRRRFRESMMGKVFPVAGYHAREERVRIIKDERGDLTWEPSS